MAEGRGCGIDKLGTTRFESMTFGGYPVGRAIHFCDERAEAIEERLLEEVLLDLLGD